MKMVKKGDFPAPFLVGKKRVWRLKDVEAWIDTIRDTSGKRIRDRGRLQWDSDPTVPLPLLDLFGSILEFPDCRSTVYFLAHGNQIMYIGESTDLPGRISTHRLNASKDPSWQFDRVYYIPCTAGERILLERKMISRFRPPWNKRSNPDFPSRIASEMSPE